MAGSRRPQFPVGYWQEAAIPNHVALSIGLPGSVFLQSKRHRARRKPHAFCGLGSGFPHVHYLHFLFVRVKSLSPAFT